MRKLFIVLIFIFLSSKSYADCFTGFACSIENLEYKQAQQEKQIIEFINSYFDRRVKEIDYGKKQSQITNYRDIFVYYKI